MELLVFTSPLLSNTIQSTLKRRVGVAKSKSFLPEENVLLRTQPLSQQTGNVGQMNAAVAGASVVAYTSQMAPQQKIDVLNSTLLAQFAANADFNKFREPRNWYERYIDVLQNLGWITESTALSEIATNTKNLRIDVAALKAIRKVPSEAGLGVLRGALEVLSSLEAEENAVTLLDSKATLENQAVFQMAIGEIDEDQSVSLAFGGYRLTGDKRRRRSLFFRWERESVRF